MPIDTLIAIAILASIGIFWIYQAHKLHDFDSYEDAINYALCEVRARNSRVRVFRTRYGKWRTQIL